MRHFTHSYTKLEDILTIHKEIVTGDISRFCISRRGSEPFWEAVK